MKVLVIGSGGREHALVWKLCRSPQVEKVWCAPGNGGIALDAECVSVDPSDMDALAQLAERLGIDLTVVGPELPLVAGIADRFAARGLTLLGPSQQAARLEGSKIFAKAFMARHGIPTAAPYGIYDAPGDAYAALCAVDWPVAIKADGLCGGKGVLVTSSPDEATAFIERLMVNREFGEGGTRLVLEEALQGEELSYIVLTDGERAIPMVPTRDYKRAYDGNQGPNTGGMGAYSTDDLLRPETEQAIRDTIVGPTIEGLRKEGCLYRGFLYFGLMLAAEGPRLLEYNCRMGDPEAQPIVMRMDFDLADAALAAAKGNLGGSQFKWKPGASICVVIASSGYPAAPTTGHRIDGLSELPSSDNLVVFHAGTRLEGAIYYTCSGRVLGVATRDIDLATARAAAYEATGRVRFQGMHYRKDVGLAGGKRAGAAGE